MPVIIIINIAIAFLVGIRDITGALSLKDGNSWITLLKSLAILVLSTQAVSPLCVGFGCVIRSEGFLRICILLLKNVANWTNHIFQKIT